MPLPRSHGVRGRGLGLLALGRRKPQHPAAWVDSCAGAKLTPAVGKPRCSSIARTPLPAFTYAKTRRLPPHLTQANTSKSNVLFSNSAQSTRGLLSFIRSFLAAASLPALASSAGGSVVRIQTSAERAHRMIRDLLDFTQARLAGGIRIERRAANLHELLQTVVDEVRATHVGRDVEVRHEGDGRGEWDPDRVEQVMQNLLTNALKYSPEGSPVEIETHVEEGA
jgi:signal transduction histidine kinase